MESIKAFCERKLLGYSVDQYIIMFVVFIIFLPHYFSLAAMVGVAIYLIYTKQLKKIIFNTPRGHWALIFGGLSMIVSLYYQNYRGFMQCIGIVFVAIFILYYRNYVDERLFTFIVDTCCLLSLCCFVWGLLEYAQIVDRLGYPFDEFIVEDSPANRINSTFYNANYYGMMIQFLVLMCLYKILHAKTIHRVVFYVVTILCNLFVLYLSGCRAGWLSFLVTIPLIFYINKRKKTSLFLVLMIVLVVVIVLLNPEIFPRFDNILRYFFNRTKIWFTAIKGICETPLFGRGPSAYYMIYESLNGRKAFHSHSVYLDPLLSFGIVGVGMICYFAWPVVKEVYRLYAKKINIELFALIICAILAVLIHGIFDYTVFWIQTGTVFLLILNSGSMYKKETNDVIL